MGLIDIVQWKVVLRDTCYTAYGTAGTTPGGLQVPNISWDVAGGAVAFLRTGFGDSSAGWEDSLAAKLGFDITAMRDNPRARLDAAWAALQLQQTSDQNIMTRAQAFDFWDALERASNALSAWSWFAPDGSSGLVGGFASGVVNDTGKNLAAVAATTVQTAAGALGQLAAASLPLAIAACVGLYLLVSK